MSTFKTVLFTAFLLYTGCLKRQEGITTYHHVKGVDIVNIAKKHLGKPYKYGATGSESFDCSGFVYAVYREAGVPIPRTSLAQSQIGGRRLSVDELKLGDILSFDTSLKGHINHSGIYIGDHKFIHASSGKAHSVTISV